eukprot:CAMPEP_0175852522 /NCGR_PEP_ID=MMETSP0107_2-20121207/26251_1 /TAXON_ID=195067 ORGANISM="Goniomonas pacifica, Strain CCMP1869" /NCGR_SAMPLE_ID=MMETSP0107_2 /ASSEMBLY_ACC=CAM_ASM_000203 /LENGTH=311 /DNA_ID=CAMNT_0017168049 /DNA_START=11 /DNA_END=947 /DNA_ORIENTATION=-
MAWGLSKRIRVRHKHLVGIPSICLFLLLVAWTYYMFMFIAVRGIADLSDDPGVPIAYMTLFHVLVALLLVSYARTIGTDPGAVPEDFVPQRDDEELGAARRTRRFCERCHCFKPERCHHCSICDRCILKMDHHCPWVNNCIGWRNHKYFLLFLFYTATAASLSAIADLHWAFVREPEASDLPISYAALFEISHTVLMCLITLFLSFFTWHHVRMALVNVTTLESFTMRESVRVILTNDPTPSDLFMSPRENWESIFGTNVWTWFNPFSCGSTGDGTTFRVHRQARLPSEEQEDPIPLRELGEDEPDDEDLY